MVDVFPDLVTLILFGAGIIVLIVVLALVRSFLKFATFAYPNARIRARRGKMFDKKQVAEIIDAKSMVDVCNLVGELAEYRKYIDKYPFEKSMDMHLAEIHELLFKISPDKFKDFFEVFVSKWDVRNIKTIITAKETGTEMIKDFIIPFGKLKKETLNKLMGAENIDNIVDALKDTEYNDILIDAIPLYKEKGILLPLEASLDKYYYRKLLKTVFEPSNDDEKILYSFVTKQIDIINLKIILRAKFEGIEFKDVGDYIISGAYQLSKWKLKELMDTEKITDFVSKLEGTDYYSVLSDVIPEYEKTGSVSALELALDKYALELARSLSKKRPLTIGPSVDFLTRKEIETKNLKIIYHAKKEGFSPEIIRDMLIGGWT
ncbi:MAG: ATP synthase A1 subunit C [Methanobacteriaceae archaeon]|jgi:V/A-type H+-transporting ATPase subunit C